MAVRILLFGGTGMVGQAALLECLDDPDVAEVLSISRSPVPLRSPKLQSLVIDDVADLEPHADRLRGYDGTLFCLGVSSVGKQEAEYRRITYDLTLAAATVVARESPGSAFLYVSGTGTDSTERGRLMWARVKGATENALFALPLQAYGIRPGFILPRRGVQSKTRWAAVFYAVFGWVAPLIRRVRPTAVIYSDELGRAMLTIVRTRPTQRICPTADRGRLTAGS